MLSQDSEIIIIGAGVFGLSTSLWLARSGYRNITVFDRCAFDKNNYNPLDGCDGASADINKVFRTAYGKEIEYQGLALQARDIWLQWNKEIRESSASNLPPGLTPDDKVIDLCGNYFLAHGRELEGFHKESLDMMQREAPQAREQQFIKGNKEDEERLRRISPKWVEKLHVVDKIAGGHTNGFLDIAGGLTLADKACTYARFLCLQGGVKFVLGEPHGKVKNLIVVENGAQRRVAGVKTYDGQEHFGDIVIVAGGAWSSSIIPEASCAVEATAGTVVFIDVPKDRPDLWEKFHPDNFPVWSYRRGHGDDRYYQGGCFPITKEGRLKFGFRGRKFTSFRDHPTEPNLRISTPRTRFSAEPINTVPLYGLQLMKEVIHEAFPELAEIGFTDSRLCWYTDSVDNNFVIDYVPGYSESLFICTGGSGHGFKFLPILGKHVKNQLERVPDQFTRLWKWRVTSEGNICNGLEEGETGPREMSKIKMAAGAYFDTV
ncbi:uncharacterized protein A1O9_11983 [Exophiala aquamarina CBS 119918]|uniref:FAD dependent oxidoreductase domain-containing protein n=1 Tax=Exophiala aquamarina CBS 119918 TaxID=1182545 RepID=A0A072NY74_9EURO|nr:uncharacterized protein A1O9_11983 [Exophiala aquamarina CBS 119918]KEF51993.1 hypothetical protein A1O9_11983 [Exophiala aquamarina CBS 119918]